MGSHGIGVPTGLPVLAVGPRSLRDQRPQPLVVGLVGQMPELLVDDLQLLTEATQTHSGLPEAPFDHALAET